MISSKNLIFTFSIVSLIGCSSETSRNWTAVPMHDPPGQFHIDIDGIESISSDIIKADIYIETPDNPDTTRGEASLEFDCDRYAVRVTKSVMVRRATGIRIDLTGYPRDDAWVDASQAGFSDIHNFVCQNYGGAEFVPLARNFNSEVEDAARLHAACQQGDDQACESEQELIPKLEEAGMCMKEITRYAVEWQPC